MTDFPPPSDSAPSDDRSTSSQPSMPPPPPSGTAPSAWDPARPASPPPGYTAHQQWTPVATEPSGNWIGAIFAAIAMQIGAAMVLSAAAFLLFVAAISTFGNSDSGGSGTPAWGLAAVLVGLAGVALYIASGYVASRLARDGKGWLMLLAGPVLVAGLSTILSVISGVVG